MPVYLSTPPSMLYSKIEEAAEMMRSCTLCPRNCRVNRLEGQSGFCRTGKLPFISSYGPHFGEESPLVGTHGSGTIFFTNCNLGCVYCQNYSISHLGEGFEAGYEKLSAIMVELQEQGCHNINLVTPTHQAYAILKALPVAIERGLCVPIVYNCGGYEPLHVLRLLNGIVDIYMPDFKYSSSEAGLQYSLVKDYTERAREAIREMHSQVGDLIVDNNGIALRGLIVRHLVLPNDASGTRGVLDFIAGEVSKNTYINIMDQYHPCYRAFEYEPLNRRITVKEYSDALEYARRIGLKRIDKEDVRGLFI